MYVMIEYFCDTDGAFESMETRGEINETLPCPVCARKSPRCLSAVKGKVVWAWVDRGPSDPPPPGAMSTRHLAR